MRRLAAVAMAAAMLSAAPAWARDAAADAVPATPRAPAGVTLRPMVTNILDRRDDRIERDAAAPDDRASYVQTVSRSFGLTLKAPL